MEPISISILFLVVAILLLAWSHHSRTVFLVVQLEKLTEIVDIHTKRIIALEAQIELYRTGNNPKQ